MPDQPPDPLHYEMKIPPEPNSNKQNEPGKPSYDDEEDSSQTTRDKNVARGDDKSQAGRGTK